jgi:hypothetical protein
MLDALAKSLISVGINPLIVGAVIGAIITYGYLNFRKKQYEKQIQSDQEYLERVRTLSAQAGLSGDLPLDANSARYRWDGEILQATHKGKSWTLTRNELEPVISLVKSNKQNDAVSLLNKNFDFDLVAARAVVGMLERHYARVHLT